MHNSFKKERSSIKKRFIERRILLKPFIKKYGNPVIVHAVNNIKVFKKILEEGKLKLPNNHSSKKKTPYMEKLLGINNCIYYSLGFVYQTAYGFKYNLIFDLDYLKELICYRGSVSYSCYKKIIDYWYENDRTYLEKLANFNKETREVMNKYYNEEYNGKKRALFDFWKIEKITFDFIQAYPNKKELMKIIKKREKICKLKYPYSYEFTRKSYLTEYTPEIVGRKEDNLIKNKYFLGFYIEGEIPKSILKILKEKYQSKILFDGKKIENIDDL